MNTLNMILLIIGILNLIIGVIWSKSDWFNFIIKLLLLFSSGFLAFYALYLSGVVIVMSR